MVVCRYLYLGLYSSEAAAAQAYDLAALKIRGSSCQTNFPADHYLDERGQLPADEQLDNTIADLKAEAARQLLEELDEEELSVQQSACDGPASTFALIRQRVGLRRLAGLEQDLLLILKANASASGSYGQFCAADHDARRTQCNQQPYEPQDHQPDYGLQPAISSEIPMPSMHELLQVDVDCAPATTPRQAAVSMAAAGVCNQYVPGLMQGGALDSLMDPAPAAAMSPEAAARASCNELSGSSSGMLTQQLCLDDTWIHQVGSPSLVPVNALHPEPSSLTEPNTSAVPGPTLEQHGSCATVLTAVAALEASPFIPSIADGAGSPVVARQYATEPQPVAQDCAGSHTPAAGTGAGPAAASGLQSNDMSISDQLANGAQLAVNNTTSCVSITWLQSQLPPHCQLQHVVHHSRGVVGMMYAQPSSAVPAGVLWGSAVWDGSCFRYSQLYGTAQEAASLCCSVLQLISGCNQVQQPA
jgi:hypothetical protein